MKPIHFSGLGPFEQSMVTSILKGLELQTLVAYIWEENHHMGKAASSYLCWTLGYTRMTPTFHPLPVTSRSRQWPNSISFSIKVDLTLIFLHSLPKT